MTNCHRKEIDIMCSKDKCTCGDKVDKKKLLDWIGDNIDKVVEKHGSVFDCVDVVDIFDDLRNAVESGELS